MKNKAKSKKAQRPAPVPETSRTCCCCNKDAAGGEICSITGRSYCSSCSPVELLYADIGENGKGLYVSKAFIEKYRTNREELVPDVILSALPIYAVDALLEEV